MELNGSPVRPEHLEVLALTNYGHFTSMLVEGGRVRGLHLHLRRLAGDCRALFGVELDEERVRDHLRRVVSDVDCPVVARVTIHDPALDLGSIGADAEPAVLVTTRPAPRGAPAPLRLRSVPHRREEPSIKHVGLFGAMRHRRLARRAGFDDVLFRNLDGTVSELATSNIGFVRGDRIVWPRAEVLPGVTMALLRDALGEPDVEEPLTLADLAGTEAAFATNAATGIRPIRSADDVVWPTAHPGLTELRERYEEIPGEAV
ncbi:aminotransferase class IV family protein [Saccharopolyspora sp. MS10]|uniref:aminotransferase class IV family protein n=1 Tax=Saccharopolyspora sp. MS10 TaxID=3385973 RepID=UPI0039A16871